MLHASFVQIFDTHGRNVQGNLFIKFELVFVFDETVVSDSTTSGTRIFKQKINFRLKQARSNSNQTH